MEGKLMWIVGIDCYTGHKVAYPMIQCSVLLDMSKHLEDVDKQIKQVSSDMRHVQENGCQPVPQFLQQMFSNIEGASVQGMPLPDEAKAQAGISAGNQIESLMSLKQAEIIVCYEESHIALKDTKVVSSFEQLLDERVFS
ncbi:MAG: hypothetical protein F6K48_03275 [Okeania sp. SIO3H1]|nr:hypothetical protein [Okeania sp. SIO3H1]